MSRRDNFQSVATQIPFDNSSNGFTATNVQTAIEEISTGQKNFSFHLIEVNTILTIPINQHMITTSIELDGCLELNGSVVFL